MKKHPVLDPVFKDGPAVATVREEVLVSPEGKGPPALFVTETSPRLIAEVQGIPGERNGSEMDP